MVSAPASLNPQFRCAGFTRNGDPVVNDPGSSRNIRRVYPRKDLIYAWPSSRNADLPYLP
jgi:hypothetical protein